jgi:thiamine biosynthesis protein ThiS
MTSQHSESFDFCWFQHVSGTARGAAMNVLINGRPHDIPATTLADVVEHFLADRPDISARGRTVIGTACNGIFIPRGQREKCPVSPGDRIEILMPAQGG